MADKADRVNVAQVVLIITTIIAVIWFIADIVRDANKQSAQNESDVVFNITENMPFNKLVEWDERYIKTYSQNIDIKTNNVSELVLVSFIGNKDKALYVGSSTDGIYYNGTWNTTHDKSTGTFFLKKLSKDLTFGIDHTVPFALIFNESETVYNTWRLHQIDEKNEFADSPVKEFSFNLDYLLIVLPSGEKHHFVSRDGVIYHEKLKSGEDFYMARSSVNTFIGYIGKGIKRDRYYLFEGLTAQQR